MNSESEQSLAPPVRYRSLHQLVYAVLCYNLSSFYFGYSMVYFNAIEYSSLHAIFNIKLKQQTGEGLLSSCIPFGALFGAFISKYVLHWCTRRQSFFLGNAIALFAGFLVLTNLMEALLLGRILQGLCVGFFSSLTPLMVKQYSPIELSGTLGAFISPTVACGFFCGYLLPYLLSYRLPPEEYWFYSFGFTQLTIITQVVLLLKCFPDQTPKYLLAHNRMDEAKQLIHKIYKQEYCEEVFQQKMKDLNLNKCMGVIQIEQEEGKNKLDQNDLNDDDEVKEPEVSQMISCSMEKQKEYLPDISSARFFAFCMQIFQQLSGINVIVIYGSKLAEVALPQLKKQLPLIINGDKMIMAVVGIFFLNRYGRKTMMLKGIFVVFISLVGLVVGFYMKSPNSKATEALILGSFLLYISFFVMTLGPITWLYIPEIVQPPTVPFTTMTNWLCACLIIGIFPAIKEETAIIFLFFSLCTLFHFFLCRKMMVETKDKQQFQIRSEFEQIKVC